MSRSRFRVSLRLILILVALFCVALAALIQPNAIVAIAMFNVTLVVIGAAILAAYFTVGERRAFWLTFTVFAGGHLMLALGPGFDRSTTNALISTRVLRAMRPGVFLEMRGIEWFALADFAPTFSNPLLSSYLLIGQCLFSLLAGLVAGSVVWGVAPRFQKQLQRSDSPSHPDST